MKWNPWDKVADQNFKDCNFKKVRRESMNINNKYSGGCQWTESLLFGHTNKNI